MKNARRKLETPMAPAMPCKRRNKESFWQRERQLVASAKGLRTRYGCIVESDASTRLRAELSQPKHHEDHIAGRGYTSMNHKFIPMPKAIKIPDAKAAVDSQRVTRSPRCVHNRRRRTREGPEPVCVQTPWLLGWHTRGGKGEFASCRGTVQSAW